VFCNSNIVCIYALPRKGITANVKSAFQMLVRAHPEIDDIRMKRSAISVQIASFPSSFIGHCSTFDIQTMPAASPITPQIMQQGFSSRSSWLLHNLH